MIPPTPPTKSWPGEQVRESAKGPHDTTLMTLENFSGDTLEMQGHCHRIPLARALHMHTKFVCERVTFKGRHVLGGGNPRNWLLYHWGYLPILGINIFNSPS